MKKETSKISSKILALVGLVAASAAVTYFRKEIYEFSKEQYKATSKEAKKLYKKYSKKYFKK